MKTRYGDVVLEKSNGVVIHYEINGAIHLSLPDSNQNLNSTETGVYSTFYPNGTIKIDTPYTSTDFPSYANYEDLLSIRPLKDVNEAADKFTTRDQYNIEYLSNSTTVFTSDYGLYWFNYLSGYDVIL